MRLGFARTGEGGPPVGWGSDRAMGVMGCGVGRGVVGCGCSGQGRTEGVAGRELLLCSCRRPSRPRGRGWWSRGVVAQGHGGHDADGHGKGAEQVQMATANSAEDGGGAGPWVVCQRGVVRVGYRQRKVGQGVGERKGKDKRGEKKKR